MVDKLANDLAMWYNKARKNLLEEVWPSVQPASVIYVSMIRSNGVQTQRELIQILKEYESTSFTGDKLNSCVSDISKVFTANPEVKKIQGTTFGKPPRRILIEGAAGIGKTLLTKEIVFSWVNGTILKDFKLVFLVCLGDPRVHEVETIKDLLQIFTGNEVPYGLKNYILGVGGENVAFVLDGINEYPSPLQKSNTLIMQIIKGEVFQQSTVVVTSRPTATVFLHSVFDRRIEILGLSSEERDNYIKQVLCDASEKKVKLDNYLKDHPTINDLCFAPQYLAIILYLFQKNSLPNTIKDMNEFFAMHTIYKNYLTTSEIKTLKELPCDMYEIVLKLSNLAFRGLQSDKIVFSCDEIEKICPEFNHTNNGFGLMQNVQYYNQKGTRKKVYFCFLCFTMQDYLAALHVSTLSSERQTSLLRQTFWDDIYYFMWMMYVGIVGMAALIPLVPTYGKVCMLNSHTTDYLVGQLFRCNINEECLYLIQCYMEAKSNSRPECASLVFHGGRVNLNDVTLLTHSISSLLVFMSAILQWRSFELRNCNLRINSVLEYAIRYKDTLSTLEYIDLSENDISPWSVYCFIIRQCSGNSLALCGDYGMQEHINEIKNSLQATTNLKSLKLCSIGIIGLESIREILVDNTTLTKVNLSWKKTNGEEIRHKNENYILDTRSSAREINVKLCNGYLGPTPKTIDLCDKNITDDVLIAFGLFNCTTLEQLYLSQNNIFDVGAAAIANCLQSNKSLRELDISQNKIASNGMNYLITCVKHIPTLQYVDLSENDSSPWGLYCILIRNCHVDSLILCGDNGMKEHANEIKNGLEDNVKLASLTLCKIGKAGVESIREILDNNTTLNKVNLSWKKISSDAIGFEENSLLETEYMVRKRIHNKNVTVKILGDDDYCKLPKVIDLSNKNITDDKIALVAFGLSGNKIVRRLDVSENEISDYGIRAIENSFMNNTTLQELDLSLNKISCDGLNYFLKSVSNPLKLGYVNLSGNNFSPWGAYCIVIRNCCLNSLVLSGDYGMNEFVKEITDSLEVNAKIQSLTLCSIGRIGVESIAQVLYSTRNKTLCKLNLSHQELGSKEEMNKKNILLHTEYSQNTTQSDVCRMVDVNVLHDGSYMPTRIYLSNENLNDDFIALFAFGLHFNKAVKKFNISQNQISDVGARAIGNCLKRNTSLREIDMSLNRITRNGMNYLQECVGKKQMLEYVNFSGNCSSPWGVYCAVIKHCCVDNLTIVGDDGLNKHIQEVADSLQSNKRLTTLTLCNIESTAVDLIGKVLAFNTSLHNVNLFLKINKSLASKIPDIIIHRKFIGMNAESKGDEVIDVYIECNGLYEHTATSVATITIDLCTNGRVQMFNIVYKDRSDDGNAPSPWDAYCGIIKHCCSSNLTLCGDDRMKDHIKEIVHHLNMNPRLKSLTLSNVGKNGIESIKEIFANNFTLNEVNLSWKNVDSRTEKRSVLLHTKFPVLTAGLTKCSREVDINILHDGHHCEAPQTINMSKMNVNDDIAKVIAFGLYKSTTVTKLNLSNNQISNIGAIAISDSIRSNNVLQELNLSQCRIRREGALHVVDSLQVNTTLRKVDLSDNNIISDDSKIAISDFLLLRNVLKISINGMKLTLCILPETKSSMCNFSNRIIGDIGAQFISLFYLRSTEIAVTILRFSQTSISDDGAVAIGHWLGKKRIPIKVVDLSQNLITVSGMLKWANLVDTTRLEYIDLSDNQSSPWGAYCIIIRQCCVHSLTVCGDNGMKDHVKEIACSLAANKRVNSLTLCKMGKIGVESIKQVLVNNTTLNDISLLHKKFENEQARNNCKVFLHCKWPIHTVDNTVIAIASARMVCVNILDDICTFEKIDLSTVSISDDIIALLTFGLYNNTTVQQLCISHKTLSDYCVKAIGDCLRNNSTLRELDLSSSRISCSGMNYLLSSAQNQFNLEYVDLSKNDDSPWIFYCVIIKNCCQCSLTLCGDNGMEKYVKEIADNLNGNVGLESLVLCGIGRQGIIAITEVLVKNTTLNEVSLSHKKVDNKEAKEKSGVILHTKYLFHLGNIGNRNKELDINILYNPQCKCIPPTVDLSKKDINDDSITVLAFGLNNNATVQLFNVSQNNISDYGAEEIGNCLQHNTSLRHLDMSHNKISSNGMNYLLAHAEHMSALEYIDLIGNELSPWGVYCAVIRYSCANNLTVCGDDGMKYYVEDIMENLEINKKLNSLTLNYIGRTGIESIKQVLVSNTTLQDIKFSWRVSSAQPSKRKRNRTALIHRNFGLLDDKTTLESEHGFGVVSVFIQYDSQYEPLMAALVNLLTGLCNNTTIQRLSVCYNSKCDDRANSSPWSTYYRIITNCHVSNLILCGDAGMEDYIEDIIDSLKANARIESLTLRDIGRTGVKSIKDVLADNTTLNEVNFSWTENMNDNGLTEKNILIHTDFPLHKLDNRMADDSTRVVDINVLYGGDSQTLPEVINLCKMINNDILAVIAFSLCYNTTVQILDVSHNEISDDGAVAISKCLEHNNTLQNLNMSDNEITLSGAMELIKAITTNSSLQKLNISHNRISRSNQDVITIQDYLKNYRPQGLIVVLN